MGLKDDIQATQNSLAEAVSGQDAGRAVALYTDDAVLMPQGLPTCGSHDEIAAFFAGTFANGIIAARFTTGDVSGDEAQASETGQYALYASGPGGDRICVAEGRYLIVWKKVNGAWRIYRDMFNT